MHIGTFMKLFMFAILVSIAIITGYFGFLALTESSEYWKTFGWMSFVTIFIAWFMIEEAKA